MIKSEYYILCKNGLVKVKGYVIDGQPLAWSDTWNDSHYVGIHKLNDGNWGIDDLNTGLAVTSIKYRTRKEAKAALDHIYMPKLHNLWKSSRYKQQAFDFMQRVKYPKNRKDRK